MQISKQRQNDNRSALNFQKVVSDTLCDKGLFFLSCTNNTNIVKMQSYSRLSTDHMMV